MSPEVLHNEKKLLQQLALSDEKAFEQLYTHYADVIYGVAFAYTKSAAFAEEIVQDVFLKLWTKREEAGKIENFASYLYIMARNRVLNKLKSIVREKESLKKLADYFTGNSLTPEQELAFKQSNELIETAIAQLPQQQQLVYRLAKQDGLSREEIATKLGISENTVKNHMGRALQYIRAYVESNSAGMIVLLALLLLEL